MLPITETYRKGACKTLLNSSAFDWLHTVTSHTSYWKGIPGSWVRDSKFPGSYLTS